MGGLVRHEHSRGLKKMIAYVMSENKAMLALCRELGFTEEPTADDIATRVVTLVIARDRGA